MMDRAERVHLRALCEAATPGPECTGISSRWCPRCGDCTCPGDPDRGDPMDDPRCPLHAASSPHGEDEEHSPDTAALLRLGDEARAALPALLDDSERLDAVTRERDEARAGRALAEELACAIGLERDILRRERDEARAEVVAAREHTDRAVDEIRRTLPAALRLAAEDEREACAAIADAMAAWAAEHSLGVGREEGARTVAAQIRARGAGGGA